MPSSDLTARMYFDQGQTAFTRGDFAGAEDYFKKAVEKDPQYHEAHRFLAESFEKQGFAHRAKRAWERLHMITRDTSEQAEIKKRIDAL
ncbi:MAG: tetratricopeptide repeat protein [bacterium]